MLSGEVIVDKIHVLEQKKNEAKLDISKRPFVHFSEDLERHEIIRGCNIKIRTLRWVLGYDAAVVV